MTEVRTVVGVSAGQPYHQGVERKQHWTGYDLSGMTSDERDRLILALRGKGWGARKIAARVGMSVGGVQAAEARIAEGRPGRDARR
jgi:hypothetical protein